MKYRHGLLLEIISEDTNTVTTLELHNDIQIITHYADAAKGIPYAVIGGIPDHSIVTLDILGRTCKNTMLKTRIKRRKSC